MFPSAEMKRHLVQLGIGTTAASLCILWLQIRPLGILCLGIFFFWCFKTQSNLEVIPPPELNAKMLAINNRLKKFRNENPSLFCSVAIAVLGSLAILGHIVSGSYVVLGGLIIAAIVSTKYNFKIVKLETKDFSWSEKFQENDLDDEFLPEVNETNLFVLERASDLATLSSQAEDVDEKSDEIPSELLIPDSIPEVGESDSSDDELLIRPPTAVSKKVDKTPKDMEFRRGHFKKDSSISTSSSSEEELSKGLCFPEHTVVDARQPSVLSQNSNTLLATSNMLPSLMSGLVSWSMNAASAAAAADSRQSTAHHRTTPLADKGHLESSDDSDFEILETDDFK